MTVEEWHKKIVEILLSTRMRGGLCEETMSGQKCNLGKYHSEMCKKPAVALMNKLTDLGEDFWVLRCEEHLNRYHPLNRFDPDDYIVPLEPLRHTEPDRT